MTVAIRRSFPSSLRNNVTSSRAGADRQNQPTSFVELFRQRRRDPRRGGGADDRLERGEVGRSECAVTDKDKHVRDPGPAEVLAGGFRQIGETLDRHDLIAEPRKNRGLETESSPDLQRAVPGSSSSASTIWAISEG